MRCPPIRCRPGSAAAVWCPASWVHRPGIRRSGRLPSTVWCPAVCCPPRLSGRVQLVPPRPVRQATVTTGTVEVPVGCRAVERLGRRPSRPGAGAAAEPARWSVGVGGEPCRGSGRATAATRDAERPGRPGRRAERPSLWRRCGTGAGCRARWPRLPRGCRPRVGWATTVGDGCGACRRGGRAGEGRWAGRRGWGCGPGAAQADGGRSWLAAGSAVTCGNRWWACQDLNLGPHPYQQSRAYRHATLRSCRWLATVKGEVMRCNSPPTPGGSAAVTVRVCDQPAAVGGAAFGGA
jgi:hypothetical protein